MRFLFTYIVFVFCTQALVAQEVLSPLNYNPALYAKSQHTSASTRGNHRSLIVDKGTILIESDTLQLPFIDDFSTNRTKPRNFNQTNIYDSIINAYGPCDTARRVTVITGRFHLQQSWDYTYDTINKKIDSTPKAPITFKYFAGNDVNCFYAGSVSTMLYPEYYTYVFDTIHGKIISQKLMTNDTINPDTIITYAPLLYKAKLDASTLWVDNYAYVNNTLPINPPTIGVATLDGLNEKGLPYDKSSISSYGVADYLTSKPIDLSSYRYNDSVYLSFYYEAEGLGDWPNKKDSLEVEFLNQTTSKWDKVWAVRGDTVAPSFDRSFQQVLIPIVDTNAVIRTYFYNTFQFRFKNLASLTGNNDHWHIDYVRLNKNRNFQDTVIQDIAMVYPIPSLLKNYETMPAKQFTGVADLADSIQLVFNNVNYDQAIINPPATDVRSTAEEIYPTPTVFTPFYNNLPADIFRRVTLHPAADYNVPTPTGDSIVLYSQAYLGVSNSFYGNDTIKRTDVYTNTLAYDDGSAERAYGLENLGIKKFGYEFDLNTPDTLVGYQVMYSNIDVNVYDLIFYFNLWNNLKFNDPAYVDTPIYTSNNRKPYYIDSVNGYTTYVLDSPLLMQKHFYFGWAQTDTRNLQIGYDLNSTKGADHMYVFTNGTWKKSSIAQKGSPMIRLLFGHYNGFTSDIKETAKATDVIKVYPNPASNELHFVLPEEAHTYELEIYNSVGQLMLKQNLTETTVSIHEYSSGMYLIRVRDVDSSQIFQNKIIKQGE